jgi:hypothetical protein
MLNLKIATLYDFEKGHPVAITNHQSQKEWFYITWRHH